MIGGFDLGSRSVKIVLFSEQGIYKRIKYDTINFYKNYGTIRQGELKIDYESLELPPMKKVISTGYGRLTVKVAGGETIPEIKAHLYGAIYSTGLKNFTLVDLGGQDSKIIKVSNGRMIDFFTNDKCAASSGRYLENMAKVLGISVEKLSEYWNDPVELSSTCAVFGESELIGRIVEGYPLERLAAGVNYTIYKRIRPHLVRVLSDVIVFTGGVAKNKALKKIIEKETGSRVIVPDQPEFNGALGCCVYGKKCSEE